MYNFYQRKNKGLFDPTLPNTRGPQANNTDLICQFFFNQGCYKIESLHEHFQTICSQNLTPDDCLAFLVDISITNIDS